MEIISHRGYWKNLNEKNTTLAFQQSFSIGFGTETDFRDYLGEIVISHDIANSASISAVDFFSIYNQYPQKPTLALNIKADGLQVKMKQLLQENSIDNYFVFDMSIPDTIGYINSGLKFFSRQSEYEPEPAFYEECGGIWLDGFKGIWFNSTIILNHINNGKKVALVSSDLHKRDHLPLWQMLKDHHLHKNPGLILCTDIPEDATYFFKE